MIVYDNVTIFIEGKGKYETCLDEDGKVMEWLNGVGLTDGCYCKNYRWARDWSDKEHLDEKGLPLNQHYCGASKTFGGWACCCWTNGKCFEKGKSAGIQRVRNQIRNRRIKEGLIIED